jgi:hypothetical protein
MSIWVFGVLFAFGLTAMARHSGLVGRTGDRLRGSEAGRFERFWSRRDGRLLAIVWLVLFATAWLAPVALGIGLDDRHLRAAQERFPNRYIALLAVQAVAALLLVPLTAGMYLYRRAIPQIARDEADERERTIQGDVYRRTHAIIIVALAIGGALLALIPDAGRDILAFTDGYGTRWIGLLLPAWVLLFMLPSVAYAWMYPRRDDAAEGDAAEGDAA